MLAILIIVFIIILIQIIIIGIIFSNLIIDIKELNISYSETIPNEFKVDKASIVLKIYIFKILKITFIKINKDYFEIFNVKFKFNLLKKLRKNYNKINKDFGKIIKNKSEVDFKLLKPKINSLNLNLFLGTYDPFITTFSIPTISTILSIFLSSSITNYDVNTYNYNIIPKYINRNYLNMKLNTVLNFNSINLILFLLSIRKIVKISR